MKTGGTEKLSVTYNSIIAVVAAFFIILILAGLWWDFSSSRSDVFKGVQRELDQRAEGFSHYAAISARQLTFIRKKAEELLAADDGGNGEEYVKSVESSEGYFKFNHDNDSALQHAGSLVGIGNPAEMGDRKKKEIRTAVELSSVQKSIFENVRDFELTFFISGEESGFKFISCYPPWTEGGGGLELGPDSIKTFFDKIYAEKFWEDLGKGADNPGGVIWRELLYGRKEGMYANLVCASPVYTTGGFAGAVGMIVSTKDIQKYMKPLRDSEGQLFLSFGVGSIIAGSPGADSDAIESAGELFDDGKLDVKTGHVQSGGYHAFVSEIGNGPWKMVYLVDGHSLFRDFWDSFTWHLILVAGLLVFILAANALVRYFIITPAIKLVRHIKVVSAGKKPHVTNIPEAWKPWFESVSEAFPLKPLAENAPAVIFECDRDVEGEPRFRYINEGIKDLLGITPKEALSGNPPFVEMVTPVDRDGLIKSFERSAANNDLLKYECGMFSKDGVAKWVGLTARPRRDYANRMVWDGLMLDISDRKHDEEWQDTMADIVQSTDEAIFSQTLKGVIMSWNSGAKRIYGYTEEEAVGKYATMLFPENRKAKFEEILNKIRAGHRVERHETVNIDRNGKPIYVSMTLSPVKDSQKNILGISTIAHDFTQRRLAEMALTRRDKILHCIDEAAQEFLHTPEWQESVSKILSQLGDVTGFGRAYIFENVTDEQGMLFMLRRYEWKSANAPKEETPWENLNYHGGELARWESILREGGSIYGQIKDLPLSERRFFKRRGTNLVVVFPIFAGSRWWGFMGFEEYGVSATTKISEVELEALNTAASVLGAAIRRKQTDDELEAARQQEINIGSQIQKTLLVGKDPAELHGASVYSVTIPSKQVDGDFTDFIQHNNRHFDLIVGDVMGKGVPAALLGAATKSIFSRGINSIMCSSNVTSLPTPEEIVMFAQGEMGRHLVGLKRFATICYARFDLENFRADLVDCGHTPTIHYKEKKGACDLIKGDNMPLGFHEEEIYKQFSISLKPNDVLLFYSDGLVEAKNPDGDMFGIERAQQLIIDNAGSSPKDIVDTICADLSAFTGSAHFSDDLTCVVVSIEDPKEYKLLERGELEITSDMKNLDKVRKFLRGTCMKGFKFERHIVNALELAVNETVSNIMRHAYHGRPDRPILLEMEIYEEHIDVTMNHWGEKFNKIQLKTPSFDGSQVHGFGLYLIRQCVDNIRYDNKPDGSVCIQITKNISGSENANEED